MSWISRFLVVVSGFFLLLLWSHQWVPDSELLGDSAVPEETPALSQSIPELEPDQKKLIAVLRDKYRIQGKEAESIVNSAYSEAKVKGLAPLLVMAVIATESSFKADARLNQDHGLMQVNKKWHGHRFEREGGMHLAYDIPTNIKVGTDILAKMLSKEKTLEEGLQAYNGKSDTKKKQATPYPARVLNNLNKLAQAL